jgi:hypothetical protein
VTMPQARKPATARARSRRGPQLIRMSAACALGVAAALLVSCGSSGKGLIPAAQGGPLRNDFAAVNQDATSGNGSCAATETAIARTEQDFAALPASVDAGLRNNLRQGIANLSSRARALCAQPLAGTTTGTTTAKTTTTTATNTTPTTTETTTTPTTTVTTPTTTTPTTTAPGGGTVAPGGEAPAGGSQGGGTGVGAAGGSGQEGGK